MSASGFLKLTGIGLGLALAGVCFFELFSSCISSNPPDNTTLGIRANAADSVKKHKDLNEIASFLSGKTDAGQQDPIPQMATEEWKSYAREADTNWKKFNRRKLEPVRKWRTRELPKPMDTVQTLFYPFSGPDFIFADAFFPEADSYILFGLESPGNIPDPASWKDQDLKASLVALKKAIDDVTSIGFFRTVDMKVDLETASINGVTPILILFLTRSGNRVDTIIPGEIDPEGAFKPTKDFLNEKGEKSYGSAVEIRFTKTETGKHKSLVYFSTDISDEGLSKHPGIGNFLKQIPGNCLTLIKSASYLMHQGGFSTIRKTILAKSLLILQDDSGIPFRFFKESAWDVKLYGTYSRTIDLFKHKYQEDLKVAYDDQEKPGAVPFRIGYNVKFNETNLLLAMRKKGIK